MSSLVPGSYEESIFLDLWLPGMMKAYSVMPRVLESCTENEQNPLFCLRSGVLVVQQSVRSGYCAKQRKALER